jgi:hypothetical protein
VPLAFIDEVEHVNHQDGLGLVEAHPKRSGGSGDDAGERRKAIGVVQLQRDLDEARPAIMIVRQAEDDPADRDVGPDDVGEDDPRQPQDGAEPAHPDRRRLERGERPQADDRHHAAQQNLAERQRLVE